MGKCLKKKKRIVVKTRLVRFFLKNILIDIVHESKEFFQLAVNRATRLIINKRISWKFYPWYFSFSFFSLDRIINKHSIKHISLCVVNDIATYYNITNNRPVRYNYNWLIHFHDKCNARSQSIIVIVPKLFH